MSGRFRKDILPLQVFIRRRQVLSAYRNLLKAARPCEDLDLKKDVIQQIRTEFQHNKDVQDKQLLKQCIQQATRSLRQVEELCNRKKYTTVDVETSSELKSKTSMSPPDQSWINVQDSVDVRGRVGEGWPWQ